MTSPRAKLRSRAALAMSSKLPRPPSIVPAASMLLLFPERFKLFSLCHIHRHTSSITRSSRQKWANAFLSKEGKVPQPASATGRQLFSPLSLFFPSTLLQRFHLPSPLLLSEHTHKAVAECCGFLQRVSCKKRPHWKQSEAEVRVVKSAHQVIGAAIAALRRPLAAFFFLVRIPSWQKITNP